MSARNFEPILFKAKELSLDKRLKFDNVFRPGYWLYQEFNESVNIEIMKRYEAEKIEYAVPSRPLYIEKN